MKKNRCFIIFTGMAILFTACDSYLEHPVVDRHDKLPFDVVKVVPAADWYPPILVKTDEFEMPVPLGAGVNTSGAEDSPFILPDGNTLYFFFTPDVRVSAEQQLFDEVSGVWVSYKEGGTWTDAVRVWLQDPGKLALDGAVCVQGDEMWFASAREGYTGVNMFTAVGSGSVWDYWEYSGDRLMKEIQIGEVHLQGDDLYFHSKRFGGLGDYDIWVTTRNGFDYWSDPVNITEVNTSGLDGFPFISSNGNEMWLTRTYLGSSAIYRSKKVGGIWQEPELIIHRFAGESTLDDAGNLYFVHHFYKLNAESEDEMIEADIYIAKRKVAK
ncbi:MAG: hypothetical protein RBS89_04695 [Candidatus Delongbacteria bacterium]|nr:hypothetical protein [Candidatus Delongbacteria bacterium]